MFRRESCLWFVYAEFVCFVQYNCTTSQGEYLYNEESLGYRFKRPQFYRGKSFFTYEKENEKKKHLSLSIQLAMFFFFIVYLIFKLTHPVFISLTWLVGRLGLSACCCCCCCCCGWGLASRLLGGWAEGSVDKLNRRQLSIKWIVHWDILSDLLFPNKKAFGPNKKKFRIYIWITKLQIHKSAHTQNFVYSIPR